MTERNPSSRKLEGAEYRTWQLGEPDGGYPEVQYFAAVSLWIRRSICRVLGHSMGEWIVNPWLQGDRETKDRYCARCDRADVAFTT